MKNIKEKIITTTKMLQLHYSATKMNINTAESRLKENCHYTSLSLDLVVRFVIKAYYYKYC